MLQEAIDGKYYDDLIPVAGPAGIAWSRKLAQKEGIFTGVSGGSTFAIAMQIAETAPEGTVILCMLPDTGERYLSSPLFEGIPEDMTDEEVALSPRHQAIRCPKNSNHRHHLRAAVTLPTHDGEVSCCLIDSASA